MREDITAIWDGLTPEMKAAVVRGAVAATGSLIVAVFGAGAIIYQIGRQAGNAIRQNRHNETLKLKLDIYKDIIAVCRTSSDAEVDMSSLIRLFYTEMVIFKQIEQTGIQAAIPKARVPTLIEKKSAVASAVVEIVNFTERWRIIDPRIDVFGLATAVANYDINEAWWPYFNAVVGRMPTEDRSGTIFPWQPPDDATLEEIGLKGTQLIDALKTFQSYIYDLQIEMQNLLLGELFERQIPACKPVDPGFAIQLNRHRELTTYFERDTAWGQAQARIESEVRRPEQKRYQESR